MLFPGHMKNKNVSRREVSGKIRKFMVIGLFPGMIFWGCNNTPEKVAEKKPDKAAEKLVNAPQFAADSAYGYIQEQVDFGPRVPNSSAHQACGEYLVAKLKEFGAELKIQDYEANAFDGTKLYLKNIVGSFKLQEQKRILLAAHWDTRPFADKDSVRTNEPIDGANDGASGVGVLLEVARQIAADDTYDVGVDIIFFDGEDYGAPINDEKYNNVPYSGYCLGSQYWANNKHVPNYSAYYGILLDMVGGKQAKFYQEGLSMQAAPSVVKKVWDIGQRLGYSDFFIYQKSDGITDDHTFVNQIAKIPMIDIIEFDPSRDDYFGSYHHKHADNMDVIDKRTLKAIGQTVLQVIYQE